MKSLLILALLVVLSVAQVPTANPAPGSCHPVCKWQCDDPVCPAKCHPVCERPKCEMQCEELPCAKCKAKCEKPTCEVRCPKEMCEKDNCPKCETVCKPAACSVSCVPPEPVCTPMCEETKCEWKCAKPVTCPKPKCELVCEKTACDAQPTQCCPCSQTAPAMAAMAAASPAPLSGVKPSLLEIMDSARFQEKEGRDTCCPCPK